jgi:aspartyl-tRNA(Asn)/glutamyl-tRNA(Gln) amidotransferase subunit B
MENEIAKSLPELPDAKLKDLLHDYSLPVYDSEILTQTKSLANYYEEVISVTDEYKIASNWIIGDVLAVINDKKIDISDFPVSPLNLGKLINLIKDGTISGKIAKEIFPIMLENNSDPEQIVKEKNLVQISDTSEIETIIQKIIDANANKLKSTVQVKKKFLDFLLDR